MRVPIAVLAAAVVAPLTGCRGDAPPPSDPSLRVEVRVSPTPATLGGARVMVFVEDTLGRPVDDARVDVTGRMSHAGMVPVVDTAEVEAPGRWAVPAFDFTMAGDWILEVRVRLPDGRVAAADQPIRVVGPMGAARDTSPPRAGTDVGPEAGPEAGGAPAG